METKNKSSEFNLSVFWHNFTRTLPHLIWVPILLALLAGGYRFLTIRRSYSPIYEIYSVYRVSASRTGSIDLGSYGYYLDSNAASKLAATYPYVMSSDEGKALLKESYGTSYLPSNVSCRAEATMLIFTSRASTPQKASDGLHMAADVFPRAGNSILGTFKLEIFDEGVMPTAPINPLNFTTSTIQWTLIGFGAGILFIALIAYLRKTVHNTEDLRELLNIPCLGLLPQVRFKARTKANRAILLTNPKLDESYIESIRSIRFQLNKELENQRAKVIMVTSTIPGEGKSTLSSNLALTLAEQDKRVILVDCDLRKQNLKDLFGIKEPTRGLVELIAGHDSDLESALVKVEGSDLLLLSGDKIAEQPQNFLSSPRLQSIMSALRKYADYVIVDTPPSGLLSDAASLSQWVDGVIYVVRQDYVPRSSVLDSAATLNGMEIRFLGCVLNQTARSTSGSGYGYGYHRVYGAGYGAGYGYSSYGKGYGSKQSSKHSSATEPYRK